MLLVLRGNLGIDRFVDHRNHVLKRPRALLRPAPVASGSRVDRPVGRVGLAIRAGRRLIVVPHVPVDGRDLSQVRRGSQGLIVRRGWDVPLAGRLAHFGPAHGLARLDLVESGPTVLGWLVSHGLALPGPVARDVVDRLRLGPEQAHPQAGPGANRVSRLPGSGAASRIGKNQEYDSELQLTAGGGDRRPRRRRQKYGRGPDCGAVWIA